MVVICTRGGGGFNMRDGPRSMYHAAKRREGGMDSLARSLDRGGGGLFWVDASSSSSSL